MKLTDTQLVLLSAASRRDDCAIEIAPNLKGGTARNVVGKLLSEVATPTQSGTASKTSARSLNSTLPPIAKP